ncbi:hypothetical protein [Peribacillus frigoritolerans]|uniref:hypothetical protein n=1 Tax=Peribacillus frigoritolerans TaxID=450367 RepID=UPI0032E3BD6E
MMQLKDQVYGNQRNFPFEKYLYQVDAILDIGCGTGRTTLALYKKGFQNIEEKEYFISKKKKKSRVTFHSGFLY